MSSSVDSLPSQATPFTYIVVSLICGSAPLLLAFPGLHWLGWLSLGVSALIAASQYKTTFGRHMLLLAGLLALLSITPINTDISWSHMLVMGAAMTAIVLIPFVITRRVFKEKIMIFPFRFGRKWKKQEIAYVLITALVSYLIMPVYLAQGSYLNWGVELDPSHIFRLFLGTNALGIWDELFFIGTALALLRSHVPFFWANLAQAILFTSFLYELGFRGIGPLMIFFFTLSQGYIFTKSKSFLYILTIHLTIDFVLFLTLIHLHHPHLLRIFITSPF